MEVSKQLTEQDLYNIMLTIYQKSSTTDDIEVIDMVNDMKQHIISVTKTEEKVLVKK